jgi:hypothetical protein
MNKLRVIQRTTGKVGKLGLRGCAQRRRRTARHPHPQGRGPTLRASRNLAGRTQRIGVDDGLTARPVGGRAQQDGLELNVIF